MMPNCPAGGWRLPTVLLGLACVILGGCTRGASEEAAGTSDAVPSAAVTLNISGRPNAKSPWDAFDGRDPLDVEFVHDDIPFHQYMVALDKFSGRLRWKRPRQGAHAYSTPLLIEADGVEQVVSVTGGGVIAYAARTGEELWWFRHEGYSVVPRPVSGGGLVFLCTGYDHPSLLAIDPTGEGDVTETHGVWESHRGAPLNPSPLLVGRALYCVTDNGVLNCFDGRTGQIIWQQRLGGRFSASPVYADGRLYLLSEEGVTHVVAPGPKPQGLAVNELDGRTLASMAVAGRSLFIRSDRHLYRIEEPDAGEAVPEGDWPQFRGVDGQGHADGSGLPIEWGEGKNVVWKTPVPGHGWSSPVVQGNEVWLTTALDGGKLLRAVCVDRTTGRIIRETDVVRRRKSQRIHPKNSHASPTPIIDGERVYVHFGSHGTACLKRTTGEVLWRTRLPYWQHHGPAGSPIVVNDLLIVNCDGFDRPYDELDIVFDDEPPVE